MTGVGELQAAVLGEHRRTRSDVTGGYYCVYDGEDWPCRATSQSAVHVTDDDTLRPGHLSEQEVRE